MMVGGPVRSFELRCILPKEAVPFPSLQGNIHTGIYFHGRQSYKGSVHLSGTVSIRSNTRKSYKISSDFVRRKGLCNVYTPISKGRSWPYKVRSSLSSIENSDESQNLPENLQNNPEDYASELASKDFKQAQQKEEEQGGFTEVTDKEASSKFMYIEDELLTSKEKEGLGSLFVKRFIKALDVLISKLALKDSQEAQKRVEKQRRYRRVTEEASSKPVYLKDLLRQYKGELYVPEEAFKFHASEFDEFHKSLETLPQMTIEDFCKAARANQVEMVTSRARWGNNQYHDFIVELKEDPGEQSLQRKKWAMRLLVEDAKNILAEYSGPQREIERPLTPYVVPPPTMPHPVASSISSRVIIELIMVTGVVIAAAFAAGSLVSAMVFTVTSLLTVMAFRIIFPFTASLFVPLFVSLAKLTGTLLTMLITTLVPAMFSAFFGFLAVAGSTLIQIISAVFSFSISTFLLIFKMAGPIFVFSSMFALIRFTLVRRPKDFRKWDIWQAIEFSQSKPQARAEGSTGVKFSDVAGIDEAVEELQDLVNYLKSPEAYNKIGTKPPHGVLLEGPPGCGKTLLAKAIAGEAGVPFYQMAGSEFVEILVGVGAARVRDLFKRAKVNKPSVVFIDEIDALGSVRGHYSEDTGDDDYNASVMERETTLNQLLVELDGFDTGTGVIFLGATNRMDLLDPALLRPGRFDRKIRIEPPGAKGRLQILQVHASKVKLSPSVDLSVYANNLRGWTGAQLAQLLQEAALMAVRHGHDSILQYDMDQAVDLLTMGPVHRGIRQAIPWRRATAEVGMALTSHLLRRLENAHIESCHRISVIPRGQTLSRTIFNRLDDEAYLCERQPQLLHRMQVMVGGRAAEEVMYGHDLSTVSGEYLPDASWLALKMISIWNLEGPLTIHGFRTPWSRKEGIVGPQIAFEGSLYDDYGFEDGSLDLNLDDDMLSRAEKLLNDTYRRTLTLIQHYHAALAKTIYVVIERGEITGDDLDLIIDQYPADTPVHFVEEEDDKGSLPPRVGVQQLPMEVSDGAWGNTIQEQKLRSNIPI
uniref:TSA: Wollemia nobilis Ref_Wollemi_Transcript_15166_3734 transcribed RNA sequence n=1 Tax=Wollemia nobilis TaxID=56998 RepID=A0A0C9RJ12_9CONI